MAATTGKHVLFYSQFCQFSNEALRVITRNNLRPAFVMVCVDHGRAQLPDFVDRVPMVLTADRRLLADEALQAFLAAVSAPQLGEPAAAGGPAASAATTFSFVDGSPAHELPADLELGSGFMVLTGREDFPSIYTPPNDSLKGGQGEPQQQQQQQQGGGGGGPYDMQPQQFQPYQQQQLHDPHMPPAGGRAPVHGLARELAPMQTRSMPSAHAPPSGAPNMDSLEATRAQELSNWWQKQRAREP